MTSPSQTADPMQYVSLEAGAVAEQLGVDPSQGLSAEEVRSRLNTAYMVCFFAGGAAGSALAAFGWSRWGWDGACAAGVLLLTLGLAGFAGTAGPGDTGMPASRLAHPG